MGRHRRRIRGRGQIFVGAHGERAVRPIVRSRWRVLGVVELASSVDKIVVHEHGLEHGELRRREAVMLGRRSRCRPGFPGRRSLFGEKRIAVQRDLRERLPEFRFVRGRQSVGDRVIAGQRLGVGSIVRKRDRRLTAERRRLSRKMAPRSNVMSVRDIENLWTAACAPPDPMATANAAASDSFGKRTA